MLDFWSLSKGRYVQEKMSREESQADSRLQARGTMALSAQIDTKAVGWLGLVYGWDEKAREGTGKSMAKVQPSIETGAPAWGYLEKAPLLYCSPSMPGTEQTHRQH